MNHDVECDLAERPRYEAEEIDDLRVPVASYVPCGDWNAETQLLAKCSLYLQAL